jgi:Endonuclease NucS
MPFPGFKLTEAYRFAAAQGLEEEARAIRSMSIHPGFDKRQRHVPRKGAFVELFESKELMDSFVQQHWPTRHTPAGIQRRQDYFDGKDLQNRFLSGEVAVPLGGNGEIPNEGEPSDADLVVFALEAHLRDFLAKNLDRIEPGLRLHSSPENPGVEYQIDGGLIDLLAVDRNGKYVVIELKLSEGRNKALGQLLYYMGWVDQHLGNGPCRGFIIASEITEELTIAVARVPGVSLAKYKMNFVIEPVTV